MILGILPSLGAGDCERILDGSLVQPVNAWTSLSYTVVGVGLAIYATRTRDRERTYRLVFGSLLALTGIGSFLYHGPQSMGAGFAHDITFLAALWFLVSIDMASGLGRRQSFVWSVFAGAVAANAAVLLAAPTVTNYLTAVAVAALVVSDLTLRRSAGVDGRMYAIALGLFGASLVANVLGKTGGPTCSPGSIIQYHGLWHTLSAMALGAYFLATARARRRKEPRR